ncbi:MAG: hypothetical protein JW778_05675 [Candidatus Altiarchaeota archaeon]|nr:hypothetical protein [Candidatus Altiarchaeota archaeon]
MIEVLLLTGGIVFIALIVSYSLTVLPMFWDSLLRYIDNKIREEVRILLDDELQRMKGEIDSLDAEIEKRREGIKQLQASVGRKLEKDKLSPIGKERNIKPLTRSDFRG